MVHRFGGRPKLIAGLVAAVLALSAVAPGFAQSNPSNGNPPAGNVAPPASNNVGTVPSQSSGGGGTGGVFGGSGTWTGSSDAQGANTYIGRVESPRAGQSVSSGASLLVSGWAADTTAQGWAGFDQMQVYTGDRANGGTKVADGSVGLSRPDVAGFLGSNFVNSGFSAVVPAGALSTGSQALYVYLHTASKGWWYQTVSVNQQAALNLDFPADPVVGFYRPCCGETITNVQYPSGTIDNYLLVGFAFDRNPQNNPNGLPKTFVEFGGPGNNGITNIHFYVDLLPGQPGYDSTVNDLGTAGSFLPINQVDTPNNHNVVQNGCSVFGGPATSCQGQVSITRGFGPQYGFAGWAKYWDQRNVTTDTFHTLYAVATSSISGHQSTASTQVYVKSTPGGGNPPCGLGSFLKHQCALLTP
jgi:hypothetical protein